MGLGLASLLLWKEYCQHLQVDFRVSASTTQNSHIAWNIHRLLNHQCSSIALAFFFIFFPLSSFLISKVFPVFLLSSDMTQHLIFFSCYNLCRSQYDLWNVSLVHPTVPHCCRFLIPTRLNYSPFPKESPWILPLLPDSHSSVTLNVLSKSFFKVIYPS